MGTLVYSTSMSLDGFIAGAGAAGVLDEIPAFIAPVLLGDGTRLFEQPGGDKIRLERLRVAEGARTTALWLRVIG